MNEFKARLKRLHRKIFRDCIFVAFVIVTLIITMTMLAFAWAFGTELCFRFAAVIFGGY